MHRPGVAQPTTDTEATTTIPLIRAGAQCTIGNLWGKGCGPLEDEPVNCGWISSAAIHNLPVLHGPARDRYGARRMRILWPNTSDDVDTVAIHADDARPAPTGRPWLMVNMIATVDGAAADARGLTGDLGGPADKAVFGALRGVADIVVAGAGTVIAENYGPSRPSTRVVDLRVARGQRPRPRIAVVTRSLTIDPDHRLFREAADDARPIVLTTEHADPGRRRALEAVADVHAAGEDHVDWHAAMAVLGSLGARVVLCEGGPRTNAALVARDLVDEMCLTVAPDLVAGPATRIVHGALAPSPRTMALERIMIQDEYLFLRYVRRRDGQ
jgi:riboflavin biosynthesis pyrimidine reductase